MAKKKALIVLGTILGLACLAVGAFFAWTQLFPDTRFVDSYDQDIIVINKNFPSEILLYGDDIHFREAVKYKKIDDIDDATLKTDKTFKYHFLIVNDLNNNLKITEDDFIRLKKHADENQLNFYYIGEQYLNVLRELGFYGVAYNDENRSVAYTISPYPPEMYSYVGIWTTNEEAALTINPEILGELLVYSFAHVIKTIN
jgi:hypothetical protein